MDIERIKAIAAQLTDVEASAFLRYRPYPGDGQLSLPSGRIVKLGSWRACMDLKDIIMSTWKYR